jgi:hypothetical protein
VVTLDGNFLIPFSITRNQFYSAIPANFSQFFPDQSMDIRNQTHRR